MIRFDPAGPILILSPHLDDAALDCWSILSGDVPTVVVSVFAGLPPAGHRHVWTKICGYDDDRELMVARRNEDVLALREYNAEVAHLAFLEGIVRDAGLTLTPTEILAEVAKHAPSARRCLAPLAGGPRPHSDHRLVRDAGRSLLAGSHAPPVSLYADIPYCVKERAWPDWQGGSGPAWLGRVVREAPEVGALFAADEVVLDEIGRSLKRRLMESYATQFKALDRGLRVKGLVSDPALYGREFFWPLSAPA